MSKVMVVEDDASLREIYSIRITAEGYEVVSAGDGEEALAVAVREKPDLILSDVMMPKISGFDMLDILRSTPETAGIKVIMMTALSADDQRQRGERLGADRYLVKSQVGIEDVVNTIHEVLGDRVTAAPAAPATPAASATPVSSPVPAQVPPAAPATPYTDNSPAPQTDYSIGPMPASAAPV
ncbi:response regulator [Candidatus Saccharibacteria bacterium]|nr:response regulator [Candidatus Saccharibacteria bacterium]